MKPPSRAGVQKYLSTLRGRSGARKIKVEYFGPLDSYEKTAMKNERQESRDIKQMGYGSPYLVVYSETLGSTVRTKKVILSTMRIGNGFGHDYRADRIDNQVLSFDTWNSLPLHARVSDIGAFNRTDSSLISLGNAGEFFLLRPMVQGKEYFHDLDRIFETGVLEEFDILRVEALAKYLAKIHSLKYRGTAKRELYERKIRDTVGHGECIFGLADSYSERPGRYLGESELEEIEKKCVSARWKLKENRNRLCQIHGDFHPWNILFKETPSTKFIVLDRSRGEWGEPADDVCAMSINYLFYALRMDGEIHGPFLDLFNRFMKTYFDITEDTGLGPAMPLFFAFRALVIASPIWYPDLTDAVRRKIFDFAQNLLDDGSFDYTDVNNYFRDV